MVDEQMRLREMVADLEDHLNGLREKQGVPKQRYEQDTDLQDIVERRLEKAAQTAIDIGRRVGRLEGEDLSDATNAEVFVALVEVGVLPDSKRQEFADIGGLRNVLAHRYRNIDPEQIYETYHDLDRLERFSEAIYRYIHDQ